VIPPKIRRTAAIILLVVTLVAWPISIFTIAKDEPVVVLSLSWFALTLTALDLAATTDTRQHQDEDDS
jgi:hypothetical protein